MRAIDAACAGWESRDGWDGRRAAMLRRREERGRTLRAARLSLRQRAERRDFIFAIELFGVVVKEGEARVEFVVWGDLSLCGVVLSGAQVRDKAFVVFEVRALATSHSGLSLLFM